MQILFDFVYAAILCIKPAQEAFIYCYNGLFKVTHHAIKLGRAVISALKLPPPAELPEWAGISYIDSLSTRELQMTSFSSHRHLMHNSEEKIDQQCPSDTRVESKAWRAGWLLRYSGFLAGRNHPEVKS